MIHLSFSLPRDQIRKFKRDRKCGINHVILAWNFATQKLIAASQGHTSHPQILCYITVVSSEFIREKCQHQDIRNEKINLFRRQPSGFRNSKHCWKSMTQNVGDFMTLCRGSTIHGMLIFELYKMVDVWEYARELLLFPLILLTYTLDNEYNIGNWI